MPALTPRALHPLCVALCFAADPNTLVIPSETFVAVVKSASSTTSTYTVYPLTTNAATAPGTACAVGTVSSITNSFGAYVTPVHASCPAGTTYDEKLDANDNAARYCRVCRLGTYCAKTAGVSPIERDCNSGTYATLFGQTSATQCTACAAGYFTDQPGQAGVDSCQACAVGISAGKDYCSNTCPDGEENLSGTCTPCTSGSFR